MNETHGYVFPRRCKACDRDDIEVEEAHYANPMGRFGTPSWFHNKCGDQLDGSTNFRMGGVLVADDEDE